MYDWFVITLLIYAGLDEVTDFIGLLIGRPGPPNTRHGAVTLIVVALLLQLVTQQSTELRALARMVPSCTA